MTWPAVHYAYLVLGASMAGGYVRGAMSVSCLSVFILPMTQEFGWSMSLFAGAVSLGGILAALVVPMLGPVVDRYGSRVVLTATLSLIGVVAFLLAVVTDSLMFYIAYILGRMAFAGPAELAIGTTVSNWFVRTRARALALVQIAMGLGMTSLPFIAQMAINAADWRTAWIVLGIIVTLAGVIPSALFIRRRPEDMGLLVDADTPPEPGSRNPVPDQIEEPAYTLAQALRTPTLWFLAAFTALIFMVQAGVSLHQVPHLIQRGLSPTEAALMVSLFAGASAFAGLLWARIYRVTGIRRTLVLCALLMGLGAFLLTRVESVAGAAFTVLLFGGSLGGVINMTYVAWADYYGRASLGAIRGVTIPVQVAGQAMGPIVAGVLFDLTGTYYVSLVGFTAVALVAAGVVWMARPPTPTGVAGDTT